jgi:hypothetical protein
LRDVILGFTSFGSWSNHLDAWQVFDRPGTLLLKYEDLVEAPQDQIPRIADFLGLQPQHQWHNDFESLSRIEPRYFRAAGANRPQQALDGADLQLFWSMHGPWMRRLGYVSAGFNAGVPEMTDAFRDTLYHAVADQIGRASAGEARADRMALDLKRQTDAACAARERLNETQRREALLQERLNDISKWGVVRAARALHLTRRVDWAKEISA